MNFPFDTKLADTKGAARHTGLSVSALNKYRVYGGGPRYFKVGRRVLYDLHVLDKWIAEHARTSTSEYRR